MSKEVYIALIQKDIRELDMIAQGLYETERLSPTIVKLASAKAQDVLNNIQKLATEQVESLAMETIVQPEIVTEEKTESAEPIVEIASNDTVAVGQSAVEEIEESIAQEPMPSVESEKVEIAVEEEPMVATQNPVTIEKESKKEDSEGKKILINRAEKRPTITEVIGQKETKIERVAKPKENVLADSLANQKISDLRRAIPIGDRFRYQKELFANDANKMNAVIDALNSCENIETAIAYISENLNWNFDDELVQNFLNVLNRRF